ncbi:MAG: PLP-dependent transferase [Alphaproteobacteria bacterium]|nr:PLP-dependent transferase [Alphaproteobacteria bacterium]
MSVDTAGKKSSIATILTAAYEDGAGSVTPPIVQTSLFTFEDYDAFEDRATGRTNQPIYTRVQNPTVSAFENMMAKIETGEAAVAFASGMAAISSSILAFIKSGDRLAAVENVYPDSFRFLEHILKPMGVGVTYHSVGAFENDPDLLDGVTMAYLESPNSMMFETVDVAKVAAHARRHNCMTLIDNSWATPIFQRPLELGIDIVIHSASKYISGHSDTVAGVVISNQQTITQIREHSLTLLGGKLAPFEAFLLLRGLRTLNIRMMAHQASANIFIERLEKTENIVKINSPKAGSVPGLTGRAGLFSVELDPKIDVRSLCNHLRIFKLGVSWGGFESLVVPTKITLAQAGEKNSLQEFNVSANLLRLSIGLEDVEDLWADFASALSQSIV